MESFEKVDNFTFGIALPKHENESLPHCQSVFDCHVGDISNCQCYTIKLNDAEKNLIAENYHDCLCIDCIKAAGTGYHQLQNELQGKKTWKASMAIKP